MIATSTYMKSTKSHITYLCRLKVKFTVKGKKKTCWTIYMKGKEDRFNLKIGTHSSFLQMKAHKWKSLDSCLVWKSKVMNNASVSIIKSVLIRWISPAPAGWKAHTAALLTNQRVGQESLRALILTSSLLDPHQSVGAGSGKQLRLVIYAHESTSNGPAAQRERLIYTQLLISWMALLLMKTHRSIQ